MRCPICDDELIRSKKDPRYGLCYTCRKKFKWVDKELFDEFNEYEDNYRVRPRKHTTSPRRNVSRFQDQNTFAPNYRQKSQKKKPVRKKKKKSFWIITILISMVIIYSCDSLSNNSENASDSSSSIVSNVDSAQEKMQEKPKTPPEPNTTEMVEYIAAQAKKSANKSATAQKREEALDFISSNFPDYFSDNETMEKTMYYGYYLEYAYASNDTNNLYANLGIDTYQVVKYVYRGSDSTESVAVQENLRQISESLNELGYNVSTEDTEKNIEEPLSQQQQEPMVWITDSGSKYHQNSSCSNMKNPQQVTEAEARNNGREACKKCY